MSAAPVPEFPILLVDDEEQALKSYDLNLRYCGLTNTIRCSDPRQVEDILRRQEVSLIMLDLCMPHLKGEEVLAQVKSRHPHVPVIVITGYNEVETAVRCMRAGSVDYLVKPVDRAHLLSAVRHALDVGQAGQQPPRPLAAQEDSPPGLSAGGDGSGRVCAGSPRAGNSPGRIVTGSARMKAMLAYAQAVAASDEPVLVSGETGVGKEMVARAIHENSGRPGKFVGVNVAGLDDAMFSDTLFGHRKGAFTGANLARRGLIEEAAGGTLFLDEIGDLGRASQLKLLRLIQEREFYALGSDTPRPMEARVIVATNQPLEEMIDQGSFRRDLYFRLRTHYVSIPPLRERMDDLPLLAAHFLAKAAQRLGKEAPECPAELLGILSGHGFPGNIRELEAMIFNAVALCEGRTLSLAPFRDWIGEGRGQTRPGLFPAVLDEGSAADKDLGKGAGERRTAGPADPPDAASGDTPTLKEAEERLIREALDRCGGSQSAAAKMLGITRQALNRRLLTKKRKGENGA
jgi:DNA-binding NtrC family response regulator